MNANLAVATLFFVCLCSSNAQIKRTSVPLGDTLDKAMSKSLLTAPGSPPFHIRLVVSEPENSQSPYQGTIEEWWVSPDQWRREVSSKEGMKQTIVVMDGRETEKDEGDYYPLWLRTFVLGAFELVPNLPAWRASGLQIEQITMPDGGKSDACVRTQGKIGSGEHPSTSYSNLCFDGEGKLKFFGSPRYSLTFSDYRKFGKKQFPMHLGSDPEPGTALLGNVTTLEDESRAPNTAGLFTPLQSEDHHFESVVVSSQSMEQLSGNNGTILWPSVHSGNTHGSLAMYVSVDTAGRVREVWPLNSDNAGLEDPARQQVRQWTFKQARDKSGSLVQVEGGLSFVFDTVVGDPIPDLSDTEVRALATTLVEPDWSSSNLAKGQVVEARVSVNEKGNLTGLGFVHTPLAAQGPVMIAVRKWVFQPLVRDGKPEYFHGTVHFVVP